MYTVRYSERSKKQLKKLDKSVQRLILNWIGKNLEGCENPRAKGKGLVENYSGEWRYRIGDYRLICDIHDKQLTILAISIGHRSSIYR